MIKTALLLSAFWIAVLTACTPAVPAPEVLEPTPAVTQAPEATVGPTDIPTRAPTDTPQPTALPPTPTDEPPAEPGLFISSGVSLDALANEPTIYEVLQSKQDTLGQLLADTTFNLAILFSAPIGEDAPLTVFAPTYTAEEIEGLFPSTDQLEAALLYHVVPGIYLQADLLALDGQTIPTQVDDQEINLSVRDGVVYLNDVAMIIEANILAKFGVIHVIDRFLVPPGE